MRTVYTDLGLAPDPVAMEESTDWLHDYTGELFDGRAAVVPGAREMLEALPPTASRWRWSPTRAGGLTDAR